MGVLESLTPGNAAWLERGRHPQETEARPLSPKGWVDKLFSSAGCTASAAPLRRLLGQKSSHRQHRSGRLGSGETSCTEAGSGPDGADAPQLFAHLALSLRYDSYQSCDVRS